MNSTPKISVVISTYNAQNYISECLDATINQTYTNLEVIIVDDGSEDDTLSILQSYAAKDSRIKLFRHSNKGVSTTRNKGIQNATGEYIVFFDDVDYSVFYIIDNDVFEVII